MSFALLHFINHFSQLSFLTHLHHASVLNCLHSSFRQVIRNFELMGRVNLDQLEMIKEQGSSAEEEDVPEMMEMVVDGENALKNGDEVMDVNEAEELRDIDNDEVMEDHFQETAEEDANEEEVKELKEEEPEKPALRGTNTVK